MWLTYGVMLVLVLDEAALPISPEGAYRDTEGCTRIVLALARIAVPAADLAVTRVRRNPARDRDGAARHGPILHRMPLRRSVNHFPQGLQGCRSRSGRPTEVR